MGGGVVWWGWELDRNKVAHLIFNSAAPLRWEDIPPGLGVFQGQFATMNWDQPLVLVNQTGAGVVSRPP
jgi:hypothetical protein